MNHSSTGQEVPTSTAATAPPPVKPREGTPLGGPATQGRNGGVLANIKDTAEQTYASLDQFWFSPADPTTLAFIRILAGTLTLYVHLCYCFGLMQYIGPNGWLDTEMADWLKHKVAIMAPVTDWPKPGEVAKQDAVGKGQFYWSIYYHVQDPGWLITIHVGILVAMALFTVGYATRTMSVLTWLGAMQYVQRIPNLMYGMDTMMMILLLYLMIGPSGATLSVDRLLEVWRARKRNESPPPTPHLVSANFAIRLLQIHFCIIYLAAGTSKLLGPTWWGGTAPQWTLLNPEFSPFDVRIYTTLASYRPLWEVLMGIGVVFTVFTELGFPFLVWLRGMTWVMVTCSVLLHLMIGITMSLFTFSAFMMAMVLAFVPPPAIHWLLRELPRWVFGKSRSSRGVAPGPEGAPLRS